MDDCRNYIWELRVNCKFSTQYCNGTNSALKFFFRYVLKKTWDQDIVPRMINDITLPKVITLDEVKKLIDSAKLIRNKAIIALLYSSGLRVSELCRLEFSDIYLSVLFDHPELFWLDNNIIIPNTNLIIIFFFCLTFFFRRFPLS